LRSRKNSSAVGGSGDPRVYQATPPAGI
jgi:hypothetical protein